MKPVDMLVPDHNPAIGAIGDCFRCSVASILELAAVEVPHFMQADWHRETPAWYADLSQWLGPRGLAYYDMEVDPQNFGAPWFEFIGADGFDVFHVMSGVSYSGHRHAVVGRNGTLAHDPHPSRKGLAGPGAEGYRFGFFMLRGVAAPQCSPLSQGGE